MPIDPLAKAITPKLINDDQALVDALRKLVWMAQRKAEDILTYGSPNEQIAVMRTLLSSATKQLGAETSTKYDDMRGDFDDLMVGIRGSENALSESPLNAAESTISATPGTANDSDQIPDD